MRIIHTSDLHYGFRPEGDASSKAIAAEICTAGGDVLTITGDLALRKPDLFRECLSLFADFPGEKLFVAGNHDLWSPPFDPMSRYTTVLGDIGAECGFHHLDRGPRMVGDVAFVGTIGWYDYDFRDPALEVDFSCYERNSWPGIASWNDKHWMKWDLSDHDFTDLCVKALAGQVAGVRDNARTIVASTHHTPFAELVISKPEDPAWVFCNAFMGSPRLGEVLSAEPKVSLVLSGHSHVRVDATIGELRAVSNGSDYSAKEYDTFEV